MDTSKKPDHMTSAELEQKIKEHQAYVRQLIEESAARRLKEKDQKPPQAGD